MLYLLKKEKGPSYYLINNETYTIGRKNTDFIIENDVSISRLHATIKIQASSANIIDNGSKYLTYVNNEALTKETPKVLQDGDIIKFGRFQSKYSIHKINIITTCSGLNKEDKKNLTTILNQFGGTLVNEWKENCTHLTVEGITLTIKYLHALISDVPVVTTKYWRKLVQSAKKKIVAPNVEDFQPPMAETILMGREMVTSSKRKTLFKNKIFLFPDEKNRSLMKDIIEKCGGTTKSWQEGSLTLLDIVNSLHKYIFIKCDNVNIPSLERIYKQLIKMGHRLIPLQEIAFAIFTCSCKKDCNPNFNIVANVFNNNQQQNVEHVPVVFDTETQIGVLEVKSEAKIIPGSYAIEFEDLQTDTCKIAELTEETSPFVINKIEIEDNSLKRFIEDDSSQQSKRLRSEESSTNTVDDREQPSTSKSLCLNNRSFPPNTSFVNKENTFTAIKRKAVEPLPQQQVKKPMTKNPFAELMNRNNTKNVSKDNPFERLKITNIPTDNEFLESQELEEEPDNVSKDIETSLRSLALCVDPSTTGWLQKSLSGNSTIEQDDELKRIYNMTIEKKEVFRKDLSDYSVNIPNSTEGKNFKKFKKVQPLRRQTTIIHTTMIGAKPTLDNSFAERFQDYEPDDPRPIMPKRVQKSTSNKFEF